MQEHVYVRTKFEPAVQLDLSTAKAKDLDAAMEKFYAHFKDQPLDPLTLTTGVHTLDQAQLEYVLRRNTQNRQLHAKPQSP